MSALIEAVWEEDVDEVRQALDAGADLEEANERGFTALFYAGGTGIPEVVELLLERGANARAVASDGSTVLHETAEGYEAHLVIPLLLAAGADPDARGENGVTAAHVAAERGHGEAAIQLLEAMRTGHPVGTDGYSLLHAACAGPALEVAKRLIEAGVSVSLTTDTGLTPLHYAAGNIGASDDAPALVELLLERGADLDAVDAEGRTPRDLVFSLDEWRW